jgi:hypothetical protein
MQFHLHLKYWTSGGNGYNNSAVWRGLVENATALPLRLQLFLHLWTLSYVLWIVHYEIFLRSGCTSHKFVTGYHCN